jgi:hypothetical protein
VRYRADATINRRDGVTELDLDVTLGRAIKRRRLIKKLDRMLRDEVAKRRDQAQVSSMVITVTVVEDEMADFDRDVERDAAE